MEIVKANYGIEDIQRRYTNLKVIEFEKSDKEFVFIIKSEVPIEDYEISHIKETLINAGKSGNGFYLVIYNGINIDRLPKALVPFT